MRINIDVSMWRETGEKKDLPYGGTLCAAKKVG